MLSPAREKFSNNDFMQMQSVYVTAAGVGPKVKRKILEMDNFRFKSICAPCTSLL